LRSQQIIGLLLDCFINETTKSETNETIQFAKLNDSFYGCISNASQVCQILPVLLMKLAFLL